MKAIITITGIILSSLVATQAWADSPKPADALLQAKILETVFAPKDESFPGSSGREVATFDRDLVAITNTDPSRHRLSDEDLAFALDPSQGAGCQLTDAKTYRNGMIAVVPRRCLKDRETLLAQIEAGTYTWIHNVYFMTVSGKSYPGIYLPLLMVKANTNEGLERLKEHLTAEGLPYRKLYTPRAVDVALTGDSAYSSPFELARELGKIDDVESAKPHFFDLEGPTPQPSMGTGN